MGNPCLTPTQLYYVHLLNLNVLWLSSLCFDLCKLGDSERGRIHKSCILKVSFPRAYRGTAKLVQSPQAEDRHPEKRTAGPGTSHGTHPCSSQCSEHQCHCFRNADAFRTTTPRLLSTACWKYPPLCL